jgi:low temperature requirement protein LtrA
VLIQIGRTAFVVGTLRGASGLRRNFQRILAWFAFSGVLWLAGGFAEGPAREAFWLLAVLVDLAAPAVGFYTPGLGRSAIGDWTITGGHLAERCQLFVIVALGESILVTGGTFADAGRSVPTVAAFVVAFIGSVALWWIYFNRSASYGSAAITSASDPGRLGRSAYTYCHLPMVAGIIVAAVGDELAIAHPADPTSGTAVAVLLGGPILFLAGHVLFKRAIAGRWLPSHLAGIAALAALTPLSLIGSLLVVATAATVVVCAVAAWDTWAVWRAERRGERVSV